MGKLYIPNHRLFSWKNYRNQKWTKYEKSQRKDKLTSATSEYLLSPFFSQRSKSDLGMLTIFLKVTQVVCDRAEPRNLGPVTTLPNTQDCISLEKSLVGKRPHCSQLRLPTCTFILYLSVFLNLFQSWEHIRLDYLKIFLLQTPYNAVLQTAKEDEACRKGSAMIRC